MTYRIKGILKLPDGAPAANCEVEFVSRKNFSPLVQGAKTNILTSSAGAYDVTLELGEYAVIVYTGGTYPAQAGTITLSADTTPGLDLPSLLNRSDWVPATPEYMQQIEAWLVSAGEYAASAEASAQSAAESAASITGAISAHEAKAGAHSIGGISGLQQALDGKEASGAAELEVSEHKADPNAHAISSITGLQSALNGKESAGAAASAISTHKAESDAHAIEKITGLREEMDSLDEKYGNYPHISVGDSISGPVIRIGKSPYLTTAQMGVVQQINTSSAPYHITVGGKNFPLGKTELTFDGRITPESLGYTSGDAASAINLMVSAAGNYVLQRNKEYPVSTRITMNASGVHLDLNQATLKWSGAPVSPPCDFATMRDTRLFIKIGESSSDGSTPYNDIEISGGELDANGQGIGIFARGVSNLKLKRFKLKNSQGAGIDLQRCVRFAIEDFTLLDCACDPSKSWSGNELEAYSDGINVWVGSQLGTIRRGEIINTRQSAASAKVARAGIVVEGYGVNGIETRDNTIENVRVRGYDRQFHAEACGSNTIRNCDFQVVNTTDKKTFGVAAIVWAVSSKIKFDNCRIVGDDMCLKLTSANDASFAHCEIGITGSGNFMQNSEYASNPAGAYNKKVVFDDCTLNFGNGGAYFNGGNYTFSDCKLLQGEANTASNFNLGTYLFDACQFNNLMFKSTTGEAGKEFITIRDVEFSGYTNPSSGGHTALRTGVSGNASVRLINPRTSQAKADVVFSCDDYLYIESPQSYQAFVNTFTLTGSRNDTYYNGDLYLSFAPTNGSHMQGQRCWNTNPTGASPVIGWVCTAGGTPGTWAQI